jgi:TolB-like protein/tetratricopeptide (TPR) repeat protein
MPIANRKIAAILAADVVGYSQLMGADDEGTLSGLKICRTNFDRLVQEFSGQVFGSIGDSLMAQFPSVINAVRCAQSIQLAMAAENKSMPADRRMLLRISVNLGDVIEENDALFGDAVNIAARLQSLATPGSIVVSRSAYDQVNNKVSATFTYRGTRRVKNFSEPVSFYEITERADAPLQQAGRTGRSRRSPKTQEQESIAVLPFVDMSPGKNQEYFSDGIAEELMNVLAKVPDLRVISRSSAFSFKGKAMGIREIARRLSVAHVLEGSVRMSGNRVRVTAQLIDAQSDKHLWSQTYDRTLDDIFAIQDDIASSVLAQFKTLVLDTTPKVNSTDPTAYALYLQARHFGGLGSKCGWERSIKLYKQALVIDPNYVAAWTGLATNYHNEMTHGNKTIEEGTRLVRESVNMALAIDPNSAIAHARLGHAAIYSTHDLAAAARHVEQALALEPTNLDVIRVAADLAQRLGRLDQSIALQGYVLASDPLDAASHSCLGYTYRYAGQLDEVIASFQTALALSPGLVSAHYFVGVALLCKGELDAALAAIQQESSEAWRLIGLAMVYDAFGRKTDSDGMLAELIAKYERNSAYNIAYVLAFREETDRAFEWLDKAVKYGDPGVAGGIGVEPLFANLQDEPRWLTYLSNLGMAPDQLEAIPFNVNLPAR